MQTLIERVLEGPFQAKKLLLPYPAPDYAEEYEKVFHCPVQFNAGVMQWHFDLKWLDVPAQMPTRLPLICVNRFVSGC